LCRASSIILQ